MFPGSSFASNIFCVMEKELTEFFGALKQPTSSRQLSTPCIHTVFIPACRLFSLNGDSSPKIQIYPSIIYHHRRRSAPGRPPPTISGLTPQKEGHHDHANHVQAVALGGKPSVAARKYSAVGGEASGVGLETSGTADRGGEAVFPNGFEMTTRVGILIRLPPAGFKPNAPYWLPVQAIPVAATFDCDPHAAPARRFPARVGHAPAREIRQDGLDEPRSFHTQFLGPDASVTQFHGLGYTNGKNIFNYRFRVEAKEFVVSVNEVGSVKLTEWGQKISSAIIMGKFGAVWMMNMVGKLRVAGKLEDFVAKYNKASMVGERSKETMYYLMQSLVCDRNHATVI